MNIIDYCMLVTAKKIISDTFGLLFKHTIYIMYKKNLENMETVYDSVDPKITIRKIEPQESSLILAVESRAEWLRNRLKAMLQGGDLCFCILAKEGAKLIGFNIIRFGVVDIPLIKCRRKFRSRCAWSEHIAIDKHYRKKGLAQILRRKVFSSLANNGISWLYGGCLKSNTASLKLAARLGFRNILEIHHYKLLFKHWWRFGRPE